MAQFLFYFFSCLTIAAAVGVVVNKNAVHAAMCLLLSLVGVAGLFVQLDAYLLAFILLLVYAGAVVALFLFIVMLLDTKDTRAVAFRKVSGLAAVAAGGLVLAAVSTFVARGRLASSDLLAVPASGATLKHYAYQIFTTYLLPVQVIGFLLLIAMVGVIVLSKKHEGADDHS